MTPDPSPLDPDEAFEEEYGTDLVDDDQQVEDQLQPEDSLDDRGVDDVLDEGYSPPEQYRGEGFGTTPDEALQGESFEERERQLEPDTDPYEPEVEQVGGEVGAERAGRLVDPDRGIGEDTESELVGDDVGIDGAGSSAEEAAVHVVEDDH